MGIFEKLFGSKKLKITDSDFGEIESITLQEKSAPYYCFNVHFENNKQVGVSIEG